MIIMLYFLKSKMTLMIYQVIVVDVGAGAELDVHFNSTSTRVFRCQIK